MDMDVVDVDVKECPLEPFLKEVFHLKKCNGNIENGLFPIFKKHNFKELNKGDKPKFSRHNLYFKHQPNGKQQSPDYHVYIKGYDMISIECKSSKSKRPMWNSGLPSLENDYIYIFHEKEELVYIFLSKHIISEEDEKELKEFDKILEEESKKFNSLKKRSFNFYVRAMYNQSFNFEYSLRNMYFDETIETIRRKDIK